MAEALQIANARGALVFSINVNTLFTGSAFLTGKFTWPNFDPMTVMYVTLL